MEPRVDAAVSETTTTVGEGTVASSGENVSLPPPTPVVAYDVVLPGVATSQSWNTDPNGDTAHETDSKSSSGSEADIDIATISRLGGGAALGAVVGTWVFPGAGSLAGAVLGGALGTFAPSILLRVRSDTQGDGGGDTRVQ